MSLSLLTTRNDALASRAASLDGPGLTPIPSRLPLSLSLALAVDRRRSRRRTAWRIATHPSLYASAAAMIVCAASLVSFVAVVIQQALLTGNESKWNIIIIVGLGAGIVATSIVLILGRIYNVQMALRSMPKPYVPNKAIDVPKAVADHVQTEYTRTAVIAYISQPTAGRQEGWGRPGSALSGVHFRSKMRETWGVLGTALDDLEAYPAGEVPSRTSPEYLLLHPSAPPSARPFLAIYAQQMERVWYARGEPSEDDFERCMKVVALVLGILQTHRAERKHQHEKRQVSPDPRVTPPQAATGPRHRRVLSASSAPTRTPEQILQDGNKAFHDSPDNF